MNVQRQSTVFVTILAALLAATVVPAVSASDMGQAAADEVSLASYQDFLDNWLYTHTGDDRRWGPEHDLAQANIAFLFESYGLTVTLEPVVYNSITYYNVVGTKLGTLYPDEEFIVGGHYDSVGNPGADDNASGVALTIETARILTQYESHYTIRFIGFDREEQGLYGSTAYVAAHSGDTILGMVSTDMVAYNTGTNQADIFARAASSDWAAALADAVTMYGQGLGYALQGSSGGSDHAPFEDAGVPACLFIEDWGNPYYHTPQDTVDTPDYIDYAFATRMTRSIVGFLVDQAEVIVPVDTLQFSYPDGLPEVVDPSGGTSIRVEVTGLGATVPQPGTGLLHWDQGGGWQSVPMQVVAKNVYDAVFPALDCPQEVLYYISAEAVGGDLYTDPTDAPASTYVALSVAGQFFIFTDDFQTDQGWSVSGDAVTGQWERGVPAGDGDRGDPLDDFDGSGMCFLTGNAAGDSDIDGGYTYLTSPLIDLSDGDALIQYALWYTNNFGADPNNDLFKTYVSNDGGGSWTLAETVGPVTSAGWTVHAFNVGDFVAPTAQVRVRFEASDLGGGSVVEAGIDAFDVFRYECPSSCPADLNGDGSVGILDLLALLAAWGPNPGHPGDLDGDGTVGILDLLALLANWGPCP